MKLCSQCRREYPDETLNFCLEDGSRLVYISTSPAVTEILPKTNPASESPTRVYSSSDSAATKTEKSIAVLPFINLSNDPDNEYFSDGLAEEILNVLSHVPGLKVTARTSCFAFRGKEQDIRTIAEALAVNSVLEGSVRRAGNRIRVTAQLINAADGYHLWSERFDRELTDVFEVQDEIATSIATALKVKLTDEASARSHQPNLPAYDAFLKGRHEYYRFNPEAFVHAEAYLKRAASLDPEWADPYSALSDLYFTLAFYGWRPLEEMMLQSRTAAHRALELNASDPMANAVLGLISALHDYDWNEAAERFAFVQATESLTPNVRLYQLFYLIALGRFAEAKDAIAKAIAQDPLNSFWPSRLAWVFVCAEEYDDAIAAARKGLELDDRNYQAMLLMALALGFGGREAEALEVAEEMFRLAPFDSFGRGFLAALLKKSGAAQRAQEMIIAMTGALPIGMTLYHLVCGEIDEAIAWYRKDIEERRPNAAMIARAAYLKPMRENPKWPEIARMMNLPE